MQIKRIYDKKVEKAAGKNIATTATVATTVGVAATSFVGLIVTGTCTFITNRKLRKIMKKMDEQEQNKQK